MLNITEANNKEFSEEFLFTYNEAFSDKEFSSVVNFLLDLKNKYPDNNIVQLWSNYKLAQANEPVNAQVACSEYKKLSEVDFPVPSLLEFKIASLCGSSKLKDLAEKPSWIREIAIEAYYDSVADSKNYSDIVSAATLVSKNSRIQVEKVKYTNIALNAAKKIDDKKNILALNERLNKLAPRLIKKPHPKQYFKIAYDYRRNRDFKRAITFYKKILKSKYYNVFQKLKAWRGIRISYKLDHNKKKYVQASFSLASLADKYYRKFPANKLFLREHFNAQITLARTLWTEGQVTKTVRILSKLKKWLKGKYPLGEVYWLLARISEEKSDFKNAIAYAHRGLSEASENTDTYKDLLWVLGWNYRKLNKLNEAETYFEQLVKSDQEASRYKFWYSKVLMENKKKSLAKTNFNELIKNFPFSYYSLLAHREMGEKIPSLYDNATTKNYLKSTKISPSDWSQVEWLILFGEKRLAQLYIKSVSKSLEQERGLNDILELLSRTESFQSLFIRLSHIEDDIKNRIVFNNPEFLFPQPWKSIVQKAAHKFGIKSELIYSVIRQESGFNPLARSPADAFGLMQILPTQARKIASANQLNFPITKAHELYNPHINIPLGAAYLRELWDKYDGQFILTIASYNAAESAVLGWVQTRYTGNPLEFIEDIPYAETKDYIKLVMRNMIYYLRMKHPNRPIHFPEWCFDNLEKFKKT